MKDFLRLGAVAMLGLLTCAVLCSPAMAQRGQCNVQQASSVSSAAVLQSAEIARLQSQLAAIQNAPAGSSATAIASAPRAVPAQRIAVQAPAPRDVVQLAPSAPPVASATAIAGAPAQLSSPVQANTKTVSRSGLAGALAARRHIFPLRRNTTVTTSTARTVTRG